MQGNKVWGFLDQRKKRKKKKVNQTLTFIYFFSGQLTLSCLIPSHALIILLVHVHTCLYS